VGRGAEKNVFGVSQSLRVVKAWSDPGFFFDILPGHEGQDFSRRLIRTDLKQAF